MDWLFSTVKSKAVLYLYIPQWKCTKKRTFLARLRIGDLRTGIERDLTLSVSGLAASGVGKVERQIVRYSEVRPYYEYYVPTILTIYFYTFIRLVQNNRSSLSNLLKEGRKNQHSQSKKQF